MQTYASPSGFAAKASLIAPPCEIVSVTGAVGGMHMSLPFRGEGGWSRPEAPLGATPAGKRYPSHHRARPPWPGLGCGQWWRCSIQAVARNLVNSRVPHVCLITQK